MSASSAAQEAQWLRYLLQDLAVFGGYSADMGPTILFGDNQGAIALTKNPETHQRSKHIDIRYHYIRDLVKEKEIEMTYVNTSDMVADALTKPLQRVLHEHHCQMMEFR